MYPRDPLLILRPLLLAAALLAQGCTGDDSRWSAVEAPKDNRVDFVTLSHEVHFGPNATTPAADEEQGLANFLSQVDFGYGDQVTLDAGPRRGEAATDALAARRMEAVAAMLRHMRVSATPASRPSVEGALARDAVVVTVGRYVVTSPLCPDFSKPEADDYTNTTQSNYGCATNTNLGLMVANPADLVHGTPTTSADGEFASHGVQRYRSGEVAKSLKPELPKLYSGAGGGQ